MAIRIQFRRSTSTRWTTTNPILAQGELGLELDTSRFKIGNGTSPWNSLPYAVNPLPSLANIDDVDLTGIEDKQFLQFDQATNTYIFADVPKFDKYIVSGLSITVPKTEHGIKFPSSIMILNGNEEVSVEVHIGQTVGVDEGDVSVFSNIPLTGHRIIIS